MRSKHHGLMALASIAGCVLLLVYYPETRGFMLFLAAFFAVSGLLLWALVKFGPNPPKNE